MSFISTITGASLIGGIKNNIIAMYEVNLDTPWEDGVMKILKEFHVSTSAPASIYEKCFYELGKANVGTKAALFSAIKQTVSDMKKDAVLVLNTRDAYYVKAIKKAYDEKNKLEFSKLTSDLVMDSKESISQLTTCYANIDSIVSKNFKLTASENTKLILDKKKNKAKVRKSNKKYSKEESLAHNRTVPCRDGEACTNTNCCFLHPEETLSSDD